MIGVLLSTGMLLLIVTLVCAFGICAVVLPFGRTVGMAERRGFSPDRWGAVALGAIVVALGAGLKVYGQGGGSRLLAPLVVLLLAWAPRAVLALIGPAQTRVGGRAGAHE